MSKIGRKPINTKNVDVTIDGQTVSYKGAKKSGTYLLPDCLHAKLENDFLKIDLTNPGDKKNNNLWGLHRALLANELMGSKEEFSENVVIVGLGYKGELKGNTIVFSLGYSHKIDFDLPANVTVSIDKTGQKLNIRSTSKFLVGDVAQRICALRQPEPYKGTGVRLQDEIIHRKTGKN
ncbi:MAG TPA: 50S ribosomal protein L6 [Candidatus Saccharimonadales bacterium]|nr:50S ribosomal protein L6 [Candidatus Saccharimonadales bacterium]